MSAHVTVATDSYRLPEKILNAMASVLHAMGLPLTNIDPHHILAAARRKTKLSHAGDDHFIHAFQSLADALQDKHITPLARLAARQVSIKAISNRLRIEDYIERHPEVLDVEIKRPIFVVGFPRTGTTVLQKLLASHPNRRALEFWELYTPVPFHDDPAEDERRRVASVDRILDIAYRFAPEMESVHEVRARSYEECWPLFANTFAMLNYQFQTGVDQYAEYLFEHDMSWAYAEYKRILQILLHQRPAEQIVLKCPEHLWFLDALLEVFPDACIVWPHRDPFDAVASYCSLISMSRRFFYGKVNCHDLGEDVVRSFLRGISRAQATRAKVPPERFYDLHFTDLVQDHVQVMKDIEQHFQFESWDGWPGAVDSFHAAKRADARGKHVYDAKRYNLDAADIRHRYRDYIDRYHIRIPNESRD
jgi:hypothetical protein